MLQVSEVNQEVMDSVDWMVSKESQENLVWLLMAVLVSQGRRVNVGSTGRMVCQDCQYVLFMILFFFFQVGKYQLM
jgi:hypothetical protein